jgi:tellurite resistance protein TehA-like permease
MLDLKRSDIKLNVAFLALVVLYFFFFNNKNFEREIDVLFPFLVLCILGIGILQIRTISKSENQAGRTYRINDLVTFISTTAFIAILLYFSYEFGADIADLRAKPGIWISQ